MIYATIIIDMNDYVTPFRFTHTLVQKIQVKYKSLRSNVLLYSEKVYMCAFRTIT